MQINLTNGFFIEYKGKSYTLMERYQGKTKSGEPRESKRTHGHFYDLKGAVRHFLELNTLKGVEAVDLWEYAEMVERSNKKAVKEFERIFLGGDKNE